TIKHFSRPPMLDQNPESAEGNTGNCRHHQKQAREQENFVQHAHHWRVGQRLMWLVPSHFRLVIHLVPDGLGVHLGSSRKYEREQGSLPFDSYPGLFCRGGKRLLQMVAVVLSYLRRGVIQKQQNAASVLPLIARQNRLGSILKANLFGQIGIGPLI